MSFGITSHILVFWMGKELGTHFLGNTQLIDIFDHASEPAGNHGLGNAVGFLVSFLMRRIEHDIQHISQKKF